MGTAKRAACALCCALAVIGASPLVSQDTNAFQSSTFLSEGLEQTDEKGLPSLKVQLSCEYCADHALLIEEQQGQREYFIIQQNRKKVIYRTTVNSTQELDKQHLQGIREALALKLKERFSIDVEGNRLVGQNLSTRANHIAIRQPKLGELLCLACALEQSAPSHLATVSPRSQGVPILFLKEPCIPGTAANWSIDPGTRSPVIKVEPADDEEFSGELERVLIHELAHNASYRLGWRPIGGESWKYFSRIGWSHFINSTTGEQGWRILTNDGFGYKRSQVTNEWVRCNASGQPLSESGTIVRRQYQAVRLSTRQVRDIAVVPPATTYFPNPMEHFAEGLMMYRYSQETRATLQEQFPSLYRIVKAADQEEIDRTFGKGKYTRDENGVLASCVPDFKTPSTPKLLPGSATPVGPARVQPFFFH
ncbi:MAG: hypothetical protein K2W95_18140 [Candidatus Obscuribacterales bacterium]|nr:hypothetical protein [Candidatus Obscuribacterales bacterium]